MARKLAPFLKRKFIVIPRKVEDSYYRRFVAPLVASFDVYAKGFNIRSEHYEPVPHLTFYEVLPDVTSATNGRAETSVAVAEDIAFELTFAYGEHRLVANQHEAVSVTVEKADDAYTFRRIVRDRARELGVMHLLKDQKLDFHQWPAVLSKNQAIDWINRNKTQLEQAGVVLHQRSTGDKKYFVGQSTMNIEVRESIDWFDIHATVRFGDYEIPFKKLRSLMLAKKHELTLAQRRGGDHSRSVVCRIFRTVCLYGESDRRRRRYGTTQEIPPGPGARPAKRRTGEGDDGP